MKEEKEKNFGKKSTDTAPYCTMHYDVTAEIHGHGCAAGFGAKCTACAR